MALPGQSGRGVALLPGCVADLRGPLVLSPSRGQPAGPGACGLAEPARRPGAVRRQHPVDAGGAAARSPCAQLRRQAQAVVAYRPAGVASVQGRNPHPVPQSRALRRHPAGRGGGQLGLSGQAAEPADPRRSGAARGAAASAQPLAPGPSSRAGPGGAAAVGPSRAKPRSQLPRAEAALLAVLPQAPSRLRPARHPERAQAARDKVLKRLASFQIWPQSAINDALEEPVLLAPRQEPRLAPLLARRLNTAGSPPLIRTTIDAALQRRLEDLLLGWRARLPERTSAAILVVEQPSMAVRAYLGSVDIGDAKRFGHVDMINAVRSPGSTLKPFLYGMALDEGLIHSESLLQDVPRRYGDYRPGNFAAGFSGAVSASEALASSLNLPAVQLLE